MKSFKDTEGREWRISINVTSVKQVRDLLKIDLLDIASGSLLEDLAGDPVKLVDTVYVLCREQAEAAGVSDEQFGRAMGGDSLETATTAFLEELADFFPSAKRQILKQLLGKVRQLEDRALSAATARLNSPALDQLLERMLGESSTASPASSASTPAPSPSAS